MQREVPLVSVLCIAHNHEGFVEEALRSALNQVGVRIELIAADNGSADQTYAVLEKLKTEYPEIAIHKFPKGSGYCSVFNALLAEAKGDFILDLSGDDVLLPQRLAKQVERLESLGQEVGVCFSNATLIEPNGQPIKEHDSVAKRKFFTEIEAKADWFSILLASYHICTPTMLMRREVLERLGGYDSNLVYEDFDFWIRSSQLTGYTYLDEVTTLKRVLPHSLSTHFKSKRAHSLFESTFRVCQKAAWFLITKDRAPLVSRVRYELGQCLRFGYFELANRYFSLLYTHETKSPIWHLYRLILYFKIPQK
jgi:glycosyltransferase involved in cell wall biosynthesis